MPVCPPAMKRSGKATAAKTTTTLTLRERADKLEHISSLEMFQVQVIWEIISGEV